MAQYDIFGTCVCWPKNCATRNNGPCRPQLLNVSFQSPDLAKLFCYLAIDKSHTHMGERIGQYSKTSTKKSRRIGPIEKANKN
jgi:hypothetical protein